MRIPADLRAQMLAHLQDRLPEEGCGLLGGTPGEARVVIPVENELHSPVRFRMRAMDQLRAFQQLENSGLELVGIFHSHPAGPEAPSATDVAEFYYPGVIAVICARAGGGWAVRAFSIEAGAVREIPIETWAAAPE